LGYSPEAWDAFTKEALGKGYKLEFLESTGLTIPRRRQAFDGFKGRVMFYTKYVWKSTGFWR
jgi:DNA primase